MFNFFSRQLYILFSGKLLAIAYLLLLGGASALFASYYFGFIELQNQNQTALSVFNQIMTPFSGAILLLSMLLLNILVVIYFSRLQQSNWLRILQTVAKADRNWYRLLVLFLSLSILPLLLLFPLLAILSSVSQFDWLHWIILSVFLISLLVIYTSVLLSIAIRQQSQFSRWLSAFVFTFVFFLLAVLPPQSLFGGLNWSNGFRQLQLGVVEGNSLVIILLMLVALSWWRSQWRLFCWQDNKTARSNMLFALALLLVAMTPKLLLLSGQQNFLSWQIDITASQRFSLSVLQQEKLALIKEPVIIKAVVLSTEAKEEIRQGFASISPLLNTPKLNFSSKLAESRNSVGKEQYIIVELAGKRQLLAYPFLRPARLAITDALLTLAKRKQQFITFIEGHQESTPFGGSGADFKHWYQAMKDAGWPVNSLKLNKVSEIPANIKLLIIASPKKQWSSTDSQKVLDYIESGGSMLILRDPDDHLPSAISHKLGVDCAKGTLVDWKGYQSGTPHPAIVIARDFAGHPLSSNFQGIVAMPWSCGLNVLPGANYEVIVKADKSVWNESDIEQENLTYSVNDGEQQKQWPLLVASQNNQQKIVVSGDSHFVSDSALNNYDNLQLGLNLASWLTSEPLIAVNKAADSSILITPTSRWLLGYMAPLVVLLPFLLVLFIGKYLLSKQTENQLAIIFGESRSKIVDN